MDRRIATGVPPANRHVVSLVETAGVEALPQITDSYREVEQKLYEHSIEAQELNVSPMYNFYASACAPLRLAIESIDHQSFELRTPEYEDYVLAGAAGRIGDPRNGDIAVAERKMMQALAEYTLTVEFDDNPHKYFERGGLSPRNYRDLTNKLGKQLLSFDPGEDSDGKLGTAQGDELAFSLFATMHALTAAAIASGNSAVRERALDYYSELIDLVESSGSPGVQESIYLGMLSRGVLKGEKTPEDILHYKEVLGEDWADCLEHYMILNLAERQRFLLRSPEARSPGAINLFRKRLDASVVLMLLSDKYRQLRKMADAGSSEDHIDTDSILDTNELFVQLDWTVLPPGEKELTEAAEGIVAEAHGEVRIDLERLKVLKEIKDAWGADRAYYARGRLKAPRKASIDGQERPDEYIVLVLQELDRGGNVVCEHAIAESPIAGPNALYVFRGDVSEDYSWREVYSVPKKEARRLGARPVKHTQVGDRPLLETMTEKVTYLITCKPDEFRTIEFNGRSVLRFRKLGSVATVDLRQAS